MRISPLLVLGLALAGQVGPAAAEERHLYLRAGIGAEMSGEATFEDRDCASGAPLTALFGCGTGSDGQPLGAMGDFGSSVMVELAAGAELTDYLRIEAAFGYRPGFAFDGNANFRRSGSQQPVSADVTQVSGMVFAYVSPLAAAGITSRLQPFLGAGAGMSYNTIGAMTYTFPELRQPRYSVTEGGTDMDLAWAVSAGLAYELNDRLTFDLAWRYSDFGTVETEAGNLFNQFRTRTLDIPIGKTEAELTSQSVSLSARWSF